MLYARYAAIVLIISLSWASQTLRENNCTMHTFAVIELFLFPSNKLLLFFLLKEKEKCVSFVLKKSLLFIFHTNPLLCVSITFRCDMLIHMPFSMPLVFLHDLLRSFHNIWKFFSSIRQFSLRGSSSIQSADKSSFLKYYWCQILTICSTCSLAWTLAFSSGKVCTQQNQSQL